MKHIHEVLAALIAGLLATGVMAVMIQTAETPEPTPVAIRPLRSPTPSPETPARANNTERTPATTAPPTASARAGATNTPEVVNAIAQRVICRPLTQSQANAFMAEYQATGQGMPVETFADGWLKLRFLEEARQCFVRFAGGRS